MSKNENDLKIEEPDLGIKQKENKIKYIEDKWIIEFLMQHTQRKDINLSQIKIPSYLNINEGEKNDD